MELRSIALALACLTAASAVPTSTRACGLPWDEPKSFFDNVDFQGHVHVVETLGYLSLGEKREPLPIYMIFNSSYAPSPYAGAFELPLLESRIVQVDENTFLLRNPAGWLLPFIRTKDKAILNGPKGTRAEIKDDQITVWSDCGERLVYSKGRILEIHKADVKLLYKYSDGRVSSIRDGTGKVLLEVKVDPQAQKLSQIAMGDGKTIGLSWGSRPIVQVVQGKRLIGATVDTVTRIVRADGSVKDFEFDVDGDLRPFVRGDHPKGIFWNPSTLLIEHDGDWTYAITPGQGRLENAAIGRTTPEGKNEFWHRNGVTGTVTTLLNGVRNVRTVFVAGPMAGQLRKVEEFRQGETQGTLLYQASYDEQGKLIRELDGGNLKEFDKQGLVRKMTKDGETLYQQVETGEPASLEGFVSSIVKNIAGNKELRMYRDKRFIGSLVLDEQGKVVKINNQ